MQSIRTAITRVGVIAAISLTGLAIGTSPASAQETSTSSGAIVDGPLIQGPLVEGQLINVGGVLNDLKIGQFQ